MEARIRYARASDGTAIACWAIGRGPPLIHLPWSPWSHVELEWQIPDFRRWYERLSADSMLIRYDARGSGLSDRHHGPFDLESQLTDLDAVVRRFGLERFGLFAPLHTGPAALTYAQRHPDRLSGVILWATYARGTDYYRAPEVLAIRSLLEKDWELYTETGAHSFVGWEEGDAAHEMALIMKEACTPEEAMQFLEAMRTVDCTPILGQIRVPALVLHPRQLPLIHLDLARGLASAIPDARLALFEGTSLAPQVVDQEGIASLIADFLTEAAARAPAETIEAAADIVYRENPDALTEREAEVLRLVADGRSNREIADILVISPRTVERHIANVYDKINANNRAQATAYAISHLHE